MWRPLWGISKLSTEQVFLKRFQVKKNALPSKTLLEWVDVTLKMKCSSIYEVSVTWELYQVEICPSREHIFNPKIVHSFSTTTCGTFVFFFENNKLRKATHTTPEWLVPFLSPLGLDDGLPWWHAAGSSEERPRTGAWDGSRE